MCGTYLVSRQKDLWSSLNIREAYTILELADWEGQRWILNYNTLLV